MNTREKVLKEALNCVNGEREKQYGNPEDNFKRIAELWSVYLTSIFEGVVFELEPIDVAKMMVLFKIARANGPKDKLDNYVDIIGYAACAAEIFEGQERNDTLQKRVEVADECKECDYSEKCAGTGVCLKKKESDKEKEASFWNVYGSVISHINIKLSSIEANINESDVVECLIKNGNGPAEMTVLLMAGELGFDDVAAYVDDAIKELKKEKIQNETK